MKITILQWNPLLRHFEENCQSALNQIQTLPPTDLILLPELWAVGFMNFDFFRETAQPINGKLVQSFQHLAKDIQTDIFMGSFVEKAHNNYFNTAIYINKSGIIQSIYRKIHLFTHRGHEAEILQAGTEVNVTKINTHMFGFATCYDLRFPELFRTMQEQGAEIFLIPAAWPMKRIEHFRVFCQSRAVENLAFVIAPNCCGGQDNKRLGGHSMVVSPFGNILAEGSEAEEILEVTLPLHEITDYRENFSALKDKKPTNFWTQK